jgi:hypothetical protein
MPAPQQWPTDNGDATNVVSLWHLLLLICFVAPIGGALASAKLAKVGFGGYALATTLGLGLGVCCAWIMKAVGAAVAARTERKSESLQERYFRALYIAAMLWIMFTVFLGEWLSSVVLRLVY